MWFPFFVVVADGTQNSTTWLHWFVNSVVWLWLIEFVIYFPFHPHPLPWVLESRMIIVILGDNTSPGCPSAISRSALPALANWIDSTWWPVIATCSRPQSIKSYIDCGCTTGHKETCQTTSALVRPRPSGRRKNLLLGSFAYAIINKFFPWEVMSRWAQPTSSMHFPRPIIQMYRIGVKTQDQISIRPESILLILDHYSHSNFLLLLVHHSWILVSLGGLFVRVGWLNGLFGAMVTCRVRPRLGGLKHCILSSKQTRALLGGGDVDNEDQCLHCPA